MSQENNNLLTLLKVTQGSQFIPGKEAQISPSASQKVILNFIVKSLIQNEPVLLVGNPASGKTTLIRYLARAKQTNLYYVNLSSDSGLEDLLGGYYQDKEGNWQYRQGLLFKAIQEGSWLFIDEANLSSLSEYLNTLIDFGYISDEEGKIITAHPNFRLFLSINPPKIHSSRNLLSPALRTRFNEIWVEEIDKREELEAMIKDWMGQESSTNTYPLPVPERTQRQTEENYGKDKVLTDIEVTGFDLPYPEQSLDNHYDVLKQRLETLRQLLGRAPPAQGHQLDAWRLAITTDLTLTHVSGGCLRYSGHLEV